MNVSKRIIRGRTCVREKYSFVVSLNKNFYTNHFCGGTLLNRLWVLTAAHCCTATRIYAIAGRDTPDEQIRLVRKQTPHPKFQQGISYIHDIALLRLNKPIKESKHISYVFMPSRTITSKDIKDICHEVLALGWGTQDPSGKKSPSSTLRCVDLPVLSPAECRQYYKYVWISNLAMCTLSKQHKDTCSGDSGGPLMCKEYNVQIGIVSAGKQYRNCGDFDNPGVCTRVDKYVDFIESTILSTAWTANYSNRKLYYYGMILLAYV